MHVVRFACNEVEMGSAKGNKHSLYPAHSGTPFGASHAHSNGHRDDRRVYASRGEDAHFPIGQGKSSRCARARVSETAPQHSIQCTAYAEYKLYI